ncbi:nucleoside hydrolase [Acrocarpospora macrocephala]
MLMQDLRNDAARRLVVDSDGGIDDAAAVFWLCAQENLRVVAITAVGGSVPAQLAARNLRIVVEAAGRPDIPIYLGLDPSAPAPRTRRPVLIHGHDGLGDVGLGPPRTGPREDETAITVLARELGRGTDLLTLGPLSNVAAAIASGAATCDSRLTFMGGSARAGGNARPWAEANIAHDPGAAAAVLGAAWSSPPLMVGLDVTHKATLTRVELELLDRRRSPAAAFLREPLQVYGRAAGTFCAPGEIPCHDLLAAMVAVDTALVETEILPVAVDTGGSAAWGQTVVDLRELARRRPGGPDDGNASAEGTPVAVALRVHVAEFRHRVRAFWGDGSSEVAKGTNYPLVNRFC